MSLQGFQLVATLLHSVENLVVAIATNIYGNNMLMGSEV